MECREVRQLAEAFVSEQLLVETTQAVVVHLERCPACRVEIDGLRRLRAATRSAFEHAPDLAVRPDFAAALTARLQQTEQARRRPARTFRRQWLAIAASALLVVGAGLGWREWTLSRTLALLHAAVGDHRFCALVYKLTESPIPLTEAARRYGPVNGRLETVEPSTASLSGGTLKILERHSCVFEGRRFAHIVLRYKGQAVSLLVTDERRSMLAMADTGVSPMPATDGFHVASFHGPRHAVFLVSSLNDDDLQEVARAMAGPVSRALAGA
jgi:anti-sigma factor RsiW